jgi:hypothetical protein
VFKRYAEAGSADIVQLREHLAPHWIRPLRAALQRQRDDMLAFASLLLALVQIRRYFAGEDAVLQGSRAM